MLTIYHVDATCMGLSKLYLQKRRHQMISCQAYILMLFLVWEKSQCVRGSDMLWSEYMDEQGNQFWSIKSVHAINYKTSQ